MLQFAVSHQGGNFIAQLRLDDGRSAVAAIGADVQGSNSPFGSSMVALASALQSLATSVAEASARLLPAALIVEIERQIERILRGPYSAAARVVQETNRSYATRSAKATEIPASLPYAAYDIANFQPLDLAGKARWISDASADQLAAILALGNARFPDVPSAIWDDLTRRYILLRHIIVSGLQADFQLVPSPSNPAAIGPDVAAAEDAAEAALERWQADHEMIEDAEAALRSVVPLVAVLIDQPIEAAWTVLTG